MGLLLDGMRGFDLAIAVETFTCGPEDGAPAHEVVLAGRVGRDRSGLTADAPAMLCRVGVESIALAELVDARHTLRQAQGTSV